MCIQDYEKNNKEIFKEKNRIFFSNNDKFSHNWRDNIWLWRNIRIKRRIPNSFLICF